MRRQLCGGSVDIDKQVKLRVSIDTVPLQLSTGEMIAVAEGLRNHDVSTQQLAVTAESEHHEFGFGFFSAAGSRKMMDFRWTETDARKLRVGLGVLVERRIDR